MREVCLMQTATRSVDVDGVFRANPVFFSKKTKMVLLGVTIYSVRKQAKTREQAGDVISFAPTSHTLSQTEKCAKTLGARSDPSMNRMPLPITR